MRAEYHRRMQWLRSGDVTVEQLQDIFVRERGLCFYCGAPVVPKTSKTFLRGFDHVVSRARGGKHTAANLVLCCGDCNEKKGSPALPIAPALQATSEMMAERGRRGVAQRIINQRARKAAQEVQS